MTGSRERPRDHRRGEDGCRGRLVAYGRWLRFRSRRRQPCGGVAVRVEVASLASVRDAAATQARRCGLNRDRIDDAVVVANELATNVVRHGGGIGRMWLWCEDGVLRYDVADRGPGLADPARVGRPPRDPASPTGRGLWLVHQLTQAMRITTGRNGTTVSVAMATTSTAPAASNRAG